MAKTEPLPGTSDLWQPEVYEWRLLEQKAVSVFECYGYGELRTPIFERTDVYVRSLGDETDVVKKEMYTFADRGGRSLTLRPEGTAGVMRAIANKGLNQGEERRVFYMGPMFRGERPAAGRRRQFHQIGVEAVGKIAPAIDVENIAMLVHFLEEIGIKDGRVLLNTRGVAEDQKNISKALNQYFAPHISQMCEDCQRRHTTNVARMLDCKNKNCQEFIKNAPQIAELICEDSKKYFQQVCSGLDRLGVEYEIAPRLVRGLDYYVHTVFEIVHSGLGAQDALAGGGRYQITVPGMKKPIQGVGFAAGMERLLMVRQALQIKENTRPEIEVYLVALGEEAVAQAPTLAQILRREGIRVLAEVEKRSMKAQMRAANRLQAPIVLIRGDDELQNNLVICKNMNDSSQEEVAIDDLLPWVKKVIASL